MSEVKIFKTPHEVFYGKFNKPQMKAIVYVQEQLELNNLEFKPSYEVGQYAHPLISDLLRESGCG